jgi:hypothetical protein
MCGGDPSPGVPFDSARPPMPASRRGSFLLPSCRAKSGVKLPTQRRPLPAGRSLTASTQSGPSPSSEELLLEVVLFISTLVKIRFLFKFKSIFSAVL